MLSIIIPTYKGLKFLELNKKMWTSLTNLIGHNNIYLIEDSLEKETENFAMCLGWNYFAKENGGKNSVLNFAIKNLDFKTRYVKIIDVDDIFNIEELEKMILAMQMEGDYDFYCAYNWNLYPDGNLKKVDFDNGEVNIHSYYPSVHIFKSIPTLPLMKCWEDQYYVYAIESLSTKYKRLKFFPYIYSVGNVNSLSNPESFDNNYYDSIIHLSKLFDWEPFKEQLSNRQVKLMPKHKSRSSLIAYIHWTLRWSYEKSRDKQSRKKILQAWKAIDKKGYQFSLKRLFLWSKLYCFFNFLPK